ncbi:MAG: FAD-dependent thymidylate synthase [Verrucomicrobia bacterium]|nr:FAD-dependent thymidylate synthase [Verrucomicrobiota bacterium]
MLQGYEEFTESQIKILEHFVTNTSSNIFVIRNVPEVIKGALFSRYSRSTLGLRSLLLKDFILNEDTAFSSIAGKHAEADASQDQLMAIQKAQNFYDRILDGYGDDSIGELGGAHLAIENVSMIAAKMIEDNRIGGSPLEKSTRYIYFDQKVNGHYLYYQEPVLMTSAYRGLFLDTCNFLFDTYSKLIPPLTAQIEKGFPKDPEISKTAYTAALRAKVLDCLRGLLPASALTNMGVFGNGRFFESLIQKLNMHNLAEMQEIGKKSIQELSKVIPSFIRRGDPAHKHYQATAQFYESMQSEIRQFAQHHIGPSVEKMTQPGARLIGSDPDAVAKVAGALLFSSSQAGLAELQDYCRKLPEEDLSRLLDAACSSRENRRHKSPRALEHAFFTFEILADFGIYRDLHRHRMLTQERQLLTCSYEYYIPPEIAGTEMEKDYVEAMERAKIAYDTIAAELPEEAQYVVPMAYNVHWYFHVNLRGLQWLCELRSQAAGHPMYRLIAQEMARQVSTAFPAFERFFKFVDYEGYELGRLGAEIRKEEKQQLHP